ALLQPGLLKRPGPLQSVTILPGPGSPPRVPRTSARASRPARSCLLEFRPASPSEEARALCSLLLHLPAERFKFLAVPRRHLTREPDAALRRLQIVSIGEARHALGPRDVVHRCRHDDAPALLAPDDRAGRRHFLEVMCLPEHADGGGEETRLLFR